MAGHFGAPHLQMTDAWGIADGYHDAFGEWRAPTPATHEALLGASTILINPLSAPLPLRTQQSSPYYPSSRRFVNPLYLRIEDVPGATTLGGELERVAALGRALSAERVIDRARVFDLKMEALERLWAKGTAAGADFERWIRERGASLRDFAIFCVLAERHGGGWHTWPSEHRRP